MVMSSSFLILELLVDDKYIMQVYAYLLASYRKKRAWKRLEVCVHYRCAPWLGGCSILDVLVYSYGVQLPVSQA